MAEDISRDQFLGGRLTLLQPRAGYRAAIDPILLAAAIPAEANQQALDLGCGIGTAGLCLARRVPGCRVRGIDIQPVLIDLARRNAMENGLQERVHFAVGDVLQPVAGSYHHVLVNPPYLERARASISPNPIKAIANIEGDARLADWIAAAVAAVRPGGSVTFIHRADRVVELRALMAAKLGDLVLLPLLPRAGQPAKRILLQGIQGAGGSFREASGLVLHQEDGTYTDAATGILRDAGALRPG